MWTYQTTKLKISYFCSPAVPDVECNALPDWPKFVVLLSATLPPCHVNTLSRHVSHSANSLFKQTGVLSVRTFYYWNSALLKRTVTVIEVYREHYLLQTAFSFNFVCAIYFLRQLFPYFAFCLGVLVGGGQTCESLQTVLNILHIEHKRQLFKN